MIRFALFALCSMALTAVAAPSKPNIIYILADDLGINDFGCYGQEIMKTPRVDQMAAEGMQFFSHYSGSTVCAPTRSCLMTGQHTGRTRVRGNGPAYLKSEDVTVAEVLKEAGYQTGVIGKWGLGEEGSSGVPNAQGFDFFFGYLDQTRAHRYYPDWIWRNGEKEEYPDNAVNRDVYIHDSFTEEGLKWIDEQSKTEAPFFLYMAYTLSHVDLDVPKDSMEPYFDIIEEDGPYKNPNYPKGYRDHPTPRACFAGMTSRLDRDVGLILDQLDKLGIAENTLVIFSSDNGPTSAGGADPDYFDGNGIYQGIKRDLYEGGIRSPMIARWPGTIEAGSKNEHISAHWDVMATLADLAGGQVPDAQVGVSFVPTLLGKSKEQKEHEYLYWEFYEKGGKQAIRFGDWKAVRLNRVKSGPDAPWEIYNLIDDPREEENLAEQNPELQGEFQKIAAEAATENEFFSWKSDKKKK
tara:strand:- start:224 stop:1621 length:1398 start_codon:yes stop_codon:yes gene_type:complete